MLDDTDSDLYTLQTAVSQTVVVVVNMQVLLESHHWTWPLVLSVLLSDLSYCVITAVCHLFPHDNFLVDSAYHLVLVTHCCTALLNCSGQVYPRLMAAWPTYLTTLLCLVTALTPDLLLRLPGTGSNIAVMRVRHSFLNQAIDVNACPPAAVKPKRNTTVPYLEPVI